MSANRIPGIEIHGYAIVSDDDMIADARGLTPPSLRNEKDWAYYQGAQARADLVVFGRVSHQFEPNTRGDRRLVISGGAAGLEKRADAWWWNPERTAWAEFATAILPSGGQVAVSGGQGAFDLFLRIGFEAFHLSRKHGVTLPGGRAVFSACERGPSAEAVLTEAGLCLNEKIALDPEHGVEMNIWRFSGP